MGTTEPIKNSKSLEKFRNYYRDVEPNSRNYLMVVTGLNTALRISDILSLHWADIYDFDRKRVSNRITLYEKKTGKLQMIATNKSFRDAVKMVLKDRPDPIPDDFVFKGYGTGHLDRSTAYRIV